MTKNSNLTKAKSAKQNEFYTMLTDIEKELKHYKSHFKDKIIFCNCDDITSEFVRYFILNFNHLGIKKLIATHFDDINPSYKIEVTEQPIDVNGDGEIDWNDVVKIPLSQNGDFRSDESIELLKECDIVISNPPFSLFREYIAQLIEYEKKFLVIGNMNAITYKEIFKLIKDNRIWLGNNYVKEFKKPDNTIQKFGNICWFTNLSHSKRNEKLILFRKYFGNESPYPKYDNYDAINVDKVVDIPVDYYDYMGVPITFLDKYNPKQFEIVGNADDKDFYIPVFGKYVGRITINQKQPFKRLFIKRK